MIHIIRAYKRGLKQKKKKRERRHSRANPRSVASKAEAVFTYPFFSFFWALCGHCCASVVISSGAQAQLPHLSLISSGGVESGAEQSSVRDGDGAGAETWR